MYSSQANARLPSSGNESVSSVCLPELVLELEITGASVLPNLHTARIEL